MKKLYFTLLCCLLAAMTSFAQFESAPAFPGAEGYGRYTTGGREGTVYHVTTLEDSTTPTEGMLRYATNKKGKRTIVFDVAGTIYLKSELKINYGDLSILGQTAPGDGICIAGYPVKFGQSQNVIMRYLRFRLGDTNNVDDDALSVSRKADTPCSDFIIDHCSISWSTDEVCSCYGNENFTLQWCILSEALHKNKVKSSAHGYGAIWGGSKASFHHNLQANNYSRNPRFDHDYVCKGLRGPLDYVNNGVYNWGDFTAYGGESCNNENAYRKINMINNYYKPGPATPSSKTSTLLYITDECSNCGSNITPGHFYISGNNLTTVRMGSSSSASTSSYISSTKFTDATWISEKGNYNTISTHTAETAWNKMLSYAGASYKRDEVDTRIVREATNGTHTYTGSSSKVKGIIDSQDDCGGYPTLSAGTPIVDTDKDGIPDEWEEAHGLTVGTNNATTYILDSKKRYYTDLEVYANHLVQHITKAERAGATETFKEYYPLDDSAFLPTTITASPASVSITGTASATVTLSSNNTEGAYSISSAPNSAVATASISGSTITITGVASGTTSLTVSQAAGSTHDAGTKTINITVSDAQGGTTGELVWNFNNLSTGGIPASQDFNITATDGKTVMVYVPGSGTASEIKASSSISGFTNALYMGGNGNTSSRYLKIPVTGTGTLEITAISNTSGATDNFTIYDGSASGTILKENFTQSNNIASSGEITVTNSIMLVCTTKTWYYQIRWIPSSTNPVTPDVPEGGYTEQGNWIIVDAGSKAGFINALNKVNTDNASSSASNKYIFLPNGTYDLGAVGMTKLSGHNVSIVGESENGVIIRSKMDVADEGLGKASTLWFSNTQNAYMQDLTIQNAMEYYSGSAAGRAACLQDEGKWTIAKNVKLLSYQDTYYSHKSGAYYYWEDSEIHGTVDFICGSGSAYFNRTKIYCESRETTANRGETTITAPGGGSTDKGYCFYDCTIDVNSATFNLGRCWKDQSSAVYINTTLMQPNKIVSDWFTLKGMGENVTPAVFSTFGMKNASGNTVSPNSTTKTFSDKNGSNSVTKNIVMSASEAANYTLDKFFTDWQPDQIAAQKTMTTPSASGKTISWSAVSEASGYLIEKDGEFVGITTTTSYIVDEDGTYTVRAANARGGFGEGVEVVVGNAPRTVFELDFEEASDNNYGFTVAAGAVATMAQVQRNDGTHMFHIYQGNNNDRTVNLTLGNESLTNYKLEFDLGITSGNSNASTLTFNGKNGVLFTVNFTGGAETAIVKKADGTELGTVSTTKYNNPNTISSSALPSTLHHFIIEGSESGITLAVTGSITETKISDTYNQVTNISNLLGRYHTHIVYDNIKLTTTDAEVPTYTVSFNAGEHGTCITEQLEEEAAGAGVTLPEAIPNMGYIFDGWYDGDTKIGNAGENYKPTANITLTAYYTTIPVTNIIVSPANKTIAVGETLQLSAQVLPAGANQSVTWSSDDTGIATVDATTGKVTANKIGTVYITATATDGSNVSDFCVLTVVAKQSGNTEVVYSWESPSGTPVETGGTIAYVNGDGNRLNYSNGGYYTICLNGKKANINDATASANAGHMEIELDKPLAAGDKFNVTAYYNKGETKDVSMYMFFDNNTEYTTANFTADIATGTTPETKSFTIEGIENSRKISLTRGASDTNLFITKIEIVRESSAPSTPTTITKYISSAEWASFVPSENVVVPSGVKVYYAKTGSYDGSSVVAVPVAEGETIAKNTGFFINGAEGNYLFNVSTATPLSITDNMLSCGANATITDRSLVFGRNYINDVLTVGFFPLTSYDILLPEGIVYIDGGLLANKAPQAISVIFDDATGIRSANEATSYKQATGIYNLSGQKVGANYKGIVIINGKKVLKR